MEDIKKTVGQNLRTICKAKGISNKQISAYIGVTESGVSHWLRGDNSLDIDNLYKICVYLGASLDQVFGLKPIVIGILNSDEEDVITAYRNSSFEEKNMIRRALNLSEKDTSSKAE